jgi:hypothetical protein
LNVSSNRIAPITPMALKIAQAMHVELTRPDGFIVHANGIVIWSGQHGKVACTSNAQARRRGKRSMRGWTYNLRWCAGECGIRKADAAPATIP